MPTLPAPEPPRESGVLEKLLKDSQGRSIRYLRMSVTDRCNLRCRYCHPIKSIEPLERGDILSYEEIVRLAAILASRGVSSLRITGGEPLVRRDLDQLVRQLAGAPGIRDIGLTTNGLLLEEIAPSLKLAGLDRVNVSLDTLRQDRFSWITRSKGFNGSGNLSTVLKGLEASLRVGLSPLKINVVLMRGFNEDEIGPFAALTMDHKYEVRFIEFMPLGPAGFWGRRKVVPTEEAIARLEEVYGTLVPMGPGKGSGAAIRYRIPGHAGTLGFISPVSSHFCHQCSRIRVTADGKLRTCLFSDLETDLRTPLRQNVSDEGVLSLIGEALLRKPESSGLGQDGENRICARTMSRIGG